MTEGDGWHYTLKHAISECHTESDLYLMRNTLISEVQGIDRMLMQLKADLIKKVDHEITDHQAKRGKSQ